MLPLIKLQASTLLHGCFSSFLNYTPNRATHYGGGAGLKHDFAFTDDLNPLVSHVEASAWKL